ncbi:cytochrome P450 [Xylariales sp. PMI_506]|nr:cytochrome P450 [Xylariales sp. PMI_506]
MAFPWRAFSLSSLVGSYLYVWSQAKWLNFGFMGMFVSIWIVQCLALATWEVILYPKYFSPIRHLPSPPGGSFFMGHFKKIRELPTGVPAREWIASVPNDGLIRYLGAFNGERILITSPKAFSEVLVTRNYDFEKPPQVKAAVARLMGLGVLVAEGEEHKIQRRNLMPAFAFRHVKDLYPTFWRISRDSVREMTTYISRDSAQLAPAADPEKVSTSLGKKSAVLEIGNWASRATLDIIGVAGLGQDFGAIKNPQSELNETYRALFQPSKQAQMLALLGLLLPTWLLDNLPVKRNQDVMGAAKTIRKVCMELIDVKKEKLARKELTDLDILSVAMESGGFTDEGLVNQLMTFLAAGHETTASAMTWAVYMLARYPDIQERLRNEIRSNLPSMDADEDVSSLQIDHLPYLNAVCSEVLRYYSPVPMTLREAVVDTTLVGHHIPKGTRIILAPWATNYDKQLWGPDADEFNPERWMPRDGADKLAASSGGATSNYALLTFLHGPRSCIGQAFAKGEFACLLASWVGRFAFELKNADELDEKNMLIKGGITARPANGLEVHTTIIDGW